MNSCTSIVHLDQGAKQPPLTEPIDLMPHKSISQQERVTVEAIARSCGVSRATVSLVLRKSPLVAEETRAMVNAEIARRGYVYHRGAASLRSCRSTKVALLINDLGNPFFMEFAQGVTDALASEGYATVFAHTDESPSRQHAALKAMAEEDAAGIILSPADGSRQSDVLDAIGTRLPLLVFNRDLSDAHDETSRWDRLMFDNEAGARTATEHLIGLGHRRIALFGGHHGLSPWRQRRKGYADAMRASGLPILPTWQVETAPTRMDAAQRADALWDSACAPTAAVCYNDIVALGLSSRHREVIGKLAVTGFDDIAEAHDRASALTTIAINPQKRGWQAARMILERIHAPTAPPRHTVVSGRLVVRSTRFTATSPGHA